MPPAETYRQFIVEPPPETEPCGDPVGVQEVAERLGLESRSVHMIGRRGQLPEPDYPTINGFRAWEWNKVLWWAGETDRLRTPELLREYRQTFGVEPITNIGNRLSPLAVATRIDRRPQVPATPSKAAARPKPKPTVKASSSKFPVTNGTKSSTGRATKAPSKKRR